MTTTDISLDRLFDDTPPLPELLKFQIHSITSESAAISMAPKAGTLRAKVLEEIKRGPKTDEELCDLTGLQGSTLRPRRVELVNLGLIETDGTGITRSGRKALKWKAVDK
jgi:hypothetical protein